MIYIQSLGILSETVIVVGNGIGDPRLIQVNIAYNNIFNKL